MVESSNDVRRNIYWLVEQNVYLVQQYCLPWITQNEHLLQYQHLSIWIFLPESVRFPPPLTIYLNFSTTFDLEMTKRGQSRRPRLSPKINPTMKFSSSKSSIYIFFNFHLKSLFGLPVGAVRKEESELGSRQIAVSGRWQWIYVCVIPSKIVRAERKCVERGERGKDVYAERAQACTKV